MRYFLTALLLVLGCALSVSAQKLPSNMSSAQARMLAQNASSEQLLGYVQQAKAAGYSLNQVKNLLRAQGASSSDLSKLNQMWNGSADGIEQPSGSTNEKIRSNFGINTVTDQTEVQENPIEFDLTEVKRFGSEFFRRPMITPQSEFFESPNKLEKQTSEIPELYIATPRDYQLGPGDELQINLYGASESTYDVQISREGTILVDRLGPVYLSGLSVEAAKIRLKNKLSEIYTGLLAVEDDPSKVSIDLSLKNARSIIVNITGQVKSPGTYTVSAFTSIINALYAAGGPNAVGTYRSIRLLRGGKLFKEIDLYDFFVGGKIPPLYLQDQDILQVPAFESQVELKGAFKFEGLIELKENETLADVIKFSGGILSGGFKERIFLNRVMEYKRSSITLPVAEGAMHILKDGDVLEASYVRNQIENGVLVEGAVYIPGTYSLESVSTIKQLIDTAGGLTPEAVKGQSTLFRVNNGIENEVVNVNLQDETALATSLKVGDRLYITSASEIFDAGLIRIEGEVNNPGVFQFKTGMSLSDVLILAQGFTANANKNEVSVYQNFLQNGQTITQTETIAISDNLSAEKEIKLFENALIIVRRDPNYRAVEEVSLHGLVLNEGNYALKGNNYRLYDLIKDAGGFLKDAYLKGISVKRRLSSDNIVDNEIIESSLLEALEGSADKEASKLEVEQQKERVSEEIQTESVIIGIDGDHLMASSGKDLRENIILQNGDVIYVPKLDNTITVLGDIQKRSKFVFDHGVSLKQAISLSGGYNQTAKRSKVYVIYKNGTIKSRRSILGIFKADPPLEPGATVVVPERLVREGSGLSLGEIVGLSSSLATLVLLIQQLGL
jgi:protein involved in polysaccharide export with SLBB domain